ncbi:hypothetical protein BDR05DRAFT_417063 [Suillus weaverae]|nr:hypothetical protein BDR05DRAFT_417063 [Suillus weaverae]
MAIWRFCVFGMCCRFLYLDTQQTLTRHANFAINRHLSYFLDPGIIATSPLDQSPHGILMLATGTNPARLAIGLAWFSLNDCWRSVPTQIVPYHS